MQAPPRPNPLTCELTGEQKTELAAVFAHLRNILDHRYGQAVHRRHDALPAWVTGGDRPHMITRSQRRRDYDGW